MTKKRHRPPLRDILHEACGMLFGIVFASMAVFAATKTNLQPWNNRIGVTVFFVVGLAIFGASGRKTVHLFRPPPPAVRKRNKRLADRMGLGIAFLAALAMVVGSLWWLLSGFVLPLLRTGTFRSGPLLAIPIASFGMAFLLILSDAARVRCPRTNAFPSRIVSPLVASGRRRALGFCFLAAFPLGVGLLILGAVVVEGFTPGHVIAVVAGGAFLAFGLFLARLAVPYAIRNCSRPFVRFHTSQGEVIPGRAIPVQCEISPSVVQGATRLLVRPFVAILTLDEETPPPLERNPEGRRSDDAAAWYGEPFLDVTDPGAMAHASFELTLPDFREFSRKEGFNPWSDSVEWRLEALLFRGSSCTRRAVYRIRVADFRR